MRETDRWQAQSDMRTLREAEDIKKDATRVDAARREAETQIKELKKVAAKKKPAGF